MRIQCMQTLNYMLLHEGDWRDYLIYCVWFDSTEECMYCDLVVLQKKSSFLISYDLKWKELDMMMCEK